MEMIELGYNEYLDYLDWVFSKWYVYMEDRNNIQEIKDRTTGRLMASLELTNFNIYTNANKKIYDKYISDTQGEK